MEFMGKDIEKLIVTLPMEDGSNLECGVFSYFEVSEKKYFALLPRLEDKTLDFSQSFMLYEVEMDDEENPIVKYIESDYEYAVAANYFSAHILNAKENH